MLLRKTVLFRGRVQGVGFRWTTRRIASRYPVSGFVMNLSDGRVELVVEGLPDRVREFLNAVREHFDGHIDAEEEATAEATGEFADFEIRHVRM